jgi:hypothetical protein
VLGSTTIRNAIDKRQQELVAQNQEEQNANYAKALVESLSAANSADVEELVREIREYRQWAFPLLEEIVAREDSNPKERLHASLALVQDDPSQVEFLFQQLLSAKADSIPIIVTFLKPHKGQLHERLWESIKTGSNDQRIRAVAAQAEFDSQSEHWEQVCEDVATALVSVPSKSDEWIEMLRPVRSALADPLVRRFTDRSVKPSDLSSQRRSPITCKMILRPSVS